MIFMTIEMMEKLVFTEAGLQLKRPRSYWVAIPNQTSITEKDFEVILTSLSLITFQREMRHCLVKVQLSTIQNLLTINPGNGPSLMEECIFSGLRYC